MKKATVIFAILAILACSAIPYKDDLGFLVSAQADSPEFPVLVNGVLCKDVDGEMGLCSKRVKSDEDVTFHFDPKPYSYRINVSCSEDLGSSFSSDILANQPFSFTIVRDKFATLKSWICIGEIFPNDRPQPVSAKWEVRIKVVDNRYVPREEIYSIKQKNKTLLVLGQNARYSWVFDQGQWKLYQKKTTVEVSDLSKAKAFSESYQMRFNSFQMNEFQPSQSLALIENEELHGIKTLQNQ